MLRHPLSSSCTRVQVAEPLFLLGPLRATDLQGRVVSQPPVSHIHVHDSLAERAARKRGLGLGLRCALVRRCHHGVVFGHRRQAAKRLEILHACV